MHTTWVEIDASALRHNLRTLRQRVTPARVMAVVKGNAYGHGLREVAAALRDEADWFGVNALHEAEVLRADGHDRPVVILGNMPPAQAEAVVRGGYRQIVYDQETVAALAAAARRQGTRARVHLTVETGTNRQGLHGDDLATIAAAVRAQPELELEGLYTHYANIEEASDFSYAGHQLGRFHEAVAIVEAGGPVPVKHTACSAAAILYPQTYFDVIRLGVSLYGLWPSEETRRAAASDGPPLTLRPALTWKARVAQVKEVARGETVGYGCTFRCERASRIAVLPAGYYEGVDRGLSNRGSVLIRGRRAPIAGRVCMNMTMVDVTDIPEARAGDEAVLLGRQGLETISAEEIAALLDTINYEVVTRIGQSVPRVLVAG
jgi:alanine racemase